MILLEGPDLIHKFAHVPLRAAFQGLLGEQSERALRCGVLVRGVVSRCPAEGKRRRPWWTPLTSPANRSTQGGVPPCIASPKIIVAATAERPEPEAGTDGSGSCVPEPLQLGTLRSHMRLVVGHRGGQA